MEILEKYILEMEEKLLRTETRESPVKDDFVEFCSSGKEYHYTKGDVFNKIEYQCKITEFKLEQLSNHCVFVTYKLIKYSKSNKEKQYSLRSSIWKLLDDNWKMIFHQGTLQTKNK
ncbi:hypothetical protein CLTEP_27010 [Clostridium tepidiprofundi DSM 19306]|uniref:DUF4440 domain-containing protein n=1 Tax=Clostridium tepidiprofundi DSM 19306 TaxID=1121338 RepID=A0A151AQ05_9CLOT|nr:hypothetical protein [Clostridium tepidiprofundi]KYH29726.1 hypothetical protein CLTEP_27010 [Clostridium tepidiprofundi DSM 19306]